jgi:hypothetical protein
MPVAHDALLDGHGEFEKWRTWSDETTHAVHEVADAAHAASTAVTLSNRKPPSSRACCALSESPLAELSPPAYAVAPSALLTQPPTRSNGVEMSQ